MKENVTLEHVARKAGVSTATVSRIINGTGKVSEERRQAVLKAIEEVGYSPNSLAQTLVKGQSMTIGVITQDISSPFYGRILKGIEQGLQGTHYHPIIVSEEWRIDQHYQAIDHLMSRRVDAIIVLDSDPRTDQVLQAARHVPVVVVGREVPGHEKHCIYIDNFRGGHLATKHLIALGHQHIVHLAGPDDHIDARDREAGYREALQEAGLPVQEDLVVKGYFNEKDALDATERLLASGVHFTAIFAGNDQAAEGAQLALYRQGLRVPQDVSVVGFDDLPSSAYSRPPLTTIHQPTLEMGKVTVQGVLDMLSGREFVSPEFSVRLVLRESTCPPRGK